MNIKQFTNDNLAGYATLEGGWKTASHSSRSLKLSPKWRQMIDEKKNSPLKPCLITNKRIENSPL